MNPITSPKNKLGFVGVGYVGGPIAQRLFKSGFRRPPMTWTALSK
jgi:3-hydroxyisobutyrate dehydrogenase-like beta-hydroxyacid dehydrogenase